MKKWQQGDTKELIVSFVEIKEIWSYIYIQASQGIQHLHFTLKIPDLTLHWSRFYCSVKASKVNQFPNRMLVSSANTAKEALAKLFL